MIRLSNERARAIEEALPPDTVAFLRDSGVPELVVFRGIEHAFTLDMEPVLDGGAFRLGSVDRGSYAMGVRQKTGHFGYVFTEPEEPSWVFCNSSVACFLLSFSASERLEHMEKAKQIASEARGEWLEREISQIDPLVSPTRTTSGRFWWRSCETAWCSACAEHFSGSNHERPYNANIWPEFPVTGSISRWQRLG